MVLVYFRQGYAVFTCTHCIYEGYYANNKRHGKGKETDNYGNIYEGDFAEGDFVSGKVSYANGDVYIGNCKNDDRHGRGKLITIDGDIFEGEWENDEFKG